MADVFKFRAKNGFEGTCPCGHEFDHITRDNNGYEATVDCPNCHREYTVFVDIEETV